MGINYKPIDYTEWNFDGKGNNIIHLLSPIGQKIWNAALQYQDKRNDTGHAENVVYFALILTDILKGKSGITIPAAILHDTGWSQLEESKPENYYKIIRTDKEPYVRIKHECEGVLLASKLLSNVEYSLDLINPILQIILGHDTRKESVSVDDIIVRDADKLWQYTYPHLHILLNEVGLKLDESYDHMMNNIDKKLYSDIAKEIARVEAQNCVDHYRKVFIKS